MRSMGRASCEECNCDTHTHTNKHTYVKPETKEICLTHRFIAIKDRYKFVEKKAPYVDIYIPSLKGFEMCDSGRRHNLSNCTYLYCHNYYVMIWGLERELVFRSGKSIITPLSCGL